MNTEYVNGTVGRNNTTVHVYAKINGHTYDATPVCGSGNTHNINRRAYKRMRPSEHPVSCKKCLDYLALHNT